MNLTSLIYTASFEGVGRKTYKELIVVDFLANYQTMLYFLKGINILK